MGGKQQTRGSGPEQTKIGAIIESDAKLTGKFLQMKMISFSSFTYSFKVHGCITVRLIKLTSGIVVHGRFSNHLIF